MMIAMKKVRAHPKANGKHRSLGNQNQRIEVGIDNEKGFIYKELTMMTDRKHSFKMNGFFTNNATRMLFTG